MLTVSDPNKTSNSHDELGGLYVSGRPIPATSHCREVSFCSQPCLPPLCGQSTRASPMPWRSWQGALKVPLMIAIMTQCCHSSGIFREELRPNAVGCDKPHPLLTLYEGNLSFGGREAWAPRYSPWSLFNGEDQTGALTAPTLCHGEKRDADPHIRGTYPVGDVFQPDRSAHHPQVRAVLRIWPSTEWRIPTPAVAAVRFCPSSAFLPPPFRKFNFALGSQSRAGAR